MSEYTLSQVSPTDKTTLAEIDALLQKEGIHCIIVPRKQAGGKAISASTVRQCLQNGDWESLKALVPATTLEYFRSPEAAPVLARIQKAGNVVHY